MSLPCPDDLWPIYILLVDDDPLIRMSAADELQDRGFTVTEAGNTDEAMASMSFFAGTIDFDLVVTDMMMPGSVNGLQFAQMLREEEPHLPVIIASGHAPQSVATDFKLLPKPYTTAELVKLITRTLGVQRRHG